ncbi:MAG TPA: GFA family protein [Polyangiaceae bacterium]|jgi:hypothetical protein|nr:GFA family protein [Polyangiaceae bacterium]
MMPCELPEERERPPLPLEVTGGCHCGAVRFRATLRTFAMSECNCSLCSMKGYLHVIVPKEDFELLSSDATYSTYRFNTKVAQHHFCRTCGVHSFYVPRSHPDGFSLNGRCLDAVDLGWFEPTRFDGQNWEASIHTLR